MILETLKFKNILNESEMNKKRKDNGKILNMILYCICYIINI